MVLSKYKADKLVSRMAKVLGSLGGMARKRKLSPERRTEIARMAGRLGGLKKGENYAKRLAKLEE